MGRIAGWPGCLRMPTELAGSVGCLSDQALRLRAVLSLALMLAVSPVLASEQNFRFIEGSGGAPIALLEWGDKSGPGILFLHGFGFSAEFWQPQFDSPALESYHMAAIDLRGHGASAKPWRVGELAETRVWAEDVAAAIAATGMNRPLIVGWSYGGFVAMDYVRHFGVDGVSGLVLVGSPAGLVDRLHPDPSDLPGGPDAYQQAAEQRLSLSSQDNLDGNRYLAELMTAADLPEAVLVQWTAAMMRVPVYVVHGLRGRSLQNEDLIASLSLPVAIAVGAKDQSMPFAALETLAEELEQGEYWQFEDAGHAVSTDSAAAFNRRLVEFAQQVRAHTE